jgi:hypothetical protein
MNNNVVAVLFFMIFGGVCFVAGVAWMRNRGRSDWEEGYERGFAKATRNLFKTAVRATTDHRAENAGRFLSRGAWARAAVKPILDSDEPTVRIPNMSDRIGDETTVVVAFRRPQTKGQAA